MDIKLEHTALLGFLKNQSSIYYGKVEELYNVIAEWLGYIPHTFPTLYPTHYPS